MRALSTLLGETVNLSILEHKDVVNLEQFVTPGRMVMRVGWVGRRIPFHTVSSGKVVVANCSEEDWPYFIENNLKKLTKNTITSPRSLTAEFKNIREQGYALACEELEEGLHAISAPLYNHLGTVLGSVTVSGPSYRLHKEKLI